MLTLYFSGTGNTEYIARLFSDKQEATCLSIESDADFIAEIESHDTIAFCYPIYGSRVPLIMRRFISRHMTALKGKKVIIFVTQTLFSGDGARVLCDLFPEGYIDVKYAEHFFLPVNVNNFMLFRIFLQPNDRRIRKQFDRAAVKMDKVCHNITNGVVKKRGFSVIARLSGKIQGIPWQGRHANNVEPVAHTMEYKAQNSVKIFEDCTACGICVKICPMQNLKYENGIISHNHDCTVCYRCANRCPERAIAVFLAARPKWQYRSASNCAIPEGVQVI